MQHGFKGKGMTNHLLVERQGNPLAIQTTGASIDEKSQVPHLLGRIRKRLVFLQKKQKIPIAELDKGYDSRAMRIYLLIAGIFPWIPYRTRISD